MASFILSIISVVAIYLSTGSESSTVMGVFIACVGIPLCMTVEEKNRKQAYYLYNTIFLLTTILIVIRYSYIVYSPDFSNAFKSGIDQTEVYERADLAHGYSSFSVLLTDTFREYQENQGYYFYVRYLAYIGYSVFDGNHAVLQMLGSSFFGCMLSIILYKIFLLYYRSTKALKYSLILFCCSPILQHSIYLLRDIHVTFVYSLAIYILLKDYKVINYIWLVVCAGVAWVIRPQSGMFAMVFIALYYYIGSRKSAALFVFAGAVLASVFFTFFWNAVTTELSDTYLYYEHRTAEIASENMSYDLIYKLPPPFKQLGQIVVYTFLPLNVWLQLTAGFDHIYPLLDVVMRVVGRVFWFYVMWLLVKWVLTRKGWNYLNFTFHGLFLVSVLFYFMNASDMNVRRTMCMSPILFLMFLLLKNGYSGHKKYVNDLKKPTIFFLATSLLYTFMRW